MDFISYHYSKQLNKVKEILHYAYMQNYIELNQIKLIYKKSIKINASFNDNLFTDYITTNKSS